MFVMQRRKNRVYKKANKGVKLSANSRAHGNLTISYSSPRVVPNSEMKMKVSRTPLFYTIPLFRKQRSRRSVNEIEYRDYREDARRHIKVLRVSIERK